MNWLVASSFQLTAPVWSFSSEEVTIHTVATELNWQFAVLNVFRTYSVLFCSVTAVWTCIYTGTLWVKRPIHLTFDHNLCKCRPIYKILSLSDSWGNFVRTCHKDFPPHLIYVSTLPCDTWQLQLLPISMAYCMWDLNIHLARYTRPT